VAGYLKPVLLRHAVAQIEQLVTSEFDQLFTLLAIEMVVLRVPVIVLVHRPASERHLTQQACFHQLAQSSVHRGPADGLIGEFFRTHFGNKFFRIEVLVVLEDMFHQQTPLFGNALAATLQKLFEPLERRKRYFDGTEWLIGGHNQTKNKKAGRSLPCPSAGRRPQIERGNPQNPTLPVYPAPIDDGELPSEPSRRAPPLPSPVPGPRRPMLVAFHRRPGRVASR